eukprot:scaffold240226_cov21-Tisochrysis_lutea.AAC.1
MRKGQCFSMNHGTIASCSTKMDRCGTGITPVHHLHVFALLHIGAATTSTFKPLQKTASNGAFQIPNRQGVWLRIQDPAPSVACMSEQLELKPLPLQACALQG